MKNIINISLALITLAACSGPAARSWTPRAISAKNQTNASKPAPQSKLQEVPRNLEDDLDAIYAQAEADRRAGDYDRAAKGYAVLCNNDRGDACTLWGTIVQAKAKTDEQRALAMKALFRGCELGSSTGCMMAGQLARAAGKDETARKLYEMSCAADTKRGAAKACAELAIMLAEGRGGPREPKRARALAFRACAADIDSGCQDLATMYLDGFGGAKNPDQGERLLTQQCGQGQASACVVLAHAYARGRGVERQPAKALALSKSACKRGTAAACVAAGDFALAGIGADADVHSALAGYDAACSLKEAKGCHKAGNVAHLELRKTKDALERFDSGCELRFGPSCVRGAELAEGPESGRLATRGCALGDGDGCAIEAELFAKGEQVPRNQRRARRALAKGRKLGSGRAEHVYATLRLTGEDGRAVDVTKAKRAFGVACRERDYGLSCVWAAAVLAEEKEFKDAQKLVAHGCHAGDWTSCVAYGETMIDADYGATDEPGALAIFLKACDGKNADGCAALGWLMATSTNPAIRDGKKAVRYGKRALRFTTHLPTFAQAEFYKVIAAGYATQGRFRLAIKYQKRALKQYESAPGEQLDEMKEQLSLYRARRPYRRS